MAKKMFIAAFLVDEEAFRAMTGEKTRTKEDVANTLAQTVTPETSPASRSGRASRTPSTTTSSTASTSRSSNGVATDMRWLALALGFWAGDAFALRFHDIFPTLAVASIAAMAISYYTRF